MKSVSQNMIGQSVALARALDHLSSLADIDRPILVLGERGTGKELAAERLHFLSPRWSQTFVKINCGAITESLLESELFGHEAGAFTGATKMHMGRFERADGGTLFLDELGTMSMRLQEKLLRLIEYGEFERVGGHKTISVDVRIIAATNADLRRMADLGEFRWDLLDRLTFDVVRLPPLRERPEDIQELANHFAIKLISELGWEVFTGFSEQAMAALQAHSWPGNVRELKNVVERSIYRWGRQEDAVDEVILNPFAGHGEGYGEGHGEGHGEGRGEGHAAQRPATAPAIDATAPRETAPLADAHSQHSAEKTLPLPVDLADILLTTERDWLEQALRQSQHQQKAAAELLGLSYAQIRGLMRKHGLRTRSARGG